MSIKNIDGNHHQKIDIHVKNAEISLLWAQSSNFCRTDATQLFLKKDACV